MEREIRTSRVTYDAGTLDESDVARDPLVQFRAWLDDALGAGTVEPNAMTVATVGEDGRPSARIVLLRGFDERGFVFYTNYGSRKGKDLAAHAAAALLFFWPALQRQIRIEGDVTRVNDEESDAYFATRPRGHRISAWASPQSAVAADRATLETAMARYDTEFAARDVPRPPYWGGYRVRPSRYEFWQGRPSRVHDRIAYESAAGAWQIARLAP